MILLLILLILKCDPDFIGGYDIERTSLIYIC
jgi:putative component of membrane protein insertase Oxa1/YidC/SpoIIIJ protein YidD